MGGAPNRLRHLGHRAHALVGEGGGAAARVPEVGALASTYGQRAQMALAYTEAYRRYCWPVNGIRDLRIAPFHLLASGSGVHVDQDHLWHLRWAKRLEEADPALLLATDHRVVSVTDPQSEAEATAWWGALTS